MDAVGAARKQAQAGLRLVAKFAFRQQPAPDADHGVGRQRQAGGEVGDLAARLADWAAFSAASL